MTENPQDVHRSCSTDHQFLFSKTDRAMDQPAESADPPAHLAAGFPAMRIGADLVESALASLSVLPGFCVLAIRLDDVQTMHDDDPSLSSYPSRVARVLDRFCQAEKGVWGWVAPGMFGGFFPGDADDDLAFAKRLQDEIHRSAGGDGSVSIGSARFPTLDFARDRILSNARKAVDHAEFFGPGSVVCFDSVSLNISGDRFYQQGDIDGAILEFEKALELDPGNVNARNSMGVCYGVLGDLEKAAAAFATAAKLDPNEAMAAYNLGLVARLAENDLEKALDYFLQADRLGGEIFEVALQIGRLYIETDQPDQARAYLEKAAALRPGAGIARRCLGECYADLRMEAEAAAAYQKAIKLNPNDAESLSALGTLMDRQGENPEIALAFCEHSVEIAPENGLFWCRLGELYLKHDDPGKAAAAFDTAQSVGYRVPAESLAALDGSRDAAEAALPGAAAAIRN